MNDDAWNKLNHDLLNDEIRTLTNTDEEFMAVCRVAGVVFDEDPTLTEHELAASAVNRVAQEWADAWSAEEE